MSDLTPQQIRDEFASLWEDQVIGKEYLLRALSNYVSTDTLAEFMDDLANDRVWAMKQPAYFRITTSYGNIRCYPVDATAKLLCELSGFKTLLPNTLGIIEELGFECLNEVNDAAIVPSMLYWEWQEQDFSTPTSWTKMMRMMI